MATINLTEDYNIVIAFKVNKSLLQQLDLYAINHKMTRSEAIRYAIMKMIEEEKR